MRIPHQHTSIYYFDSEASPTVLANVQDMISRLYALQDLSMSGQGLHMFPSDFIHENTYQSGFEPELRWTYLAILSRGS